MVSLSFLEKVEVFQGLDDDELTAIQACCQEAEFKRGDRIFGTDEEPRHLWAVIEGKVELRQDQPDIPSSQEDTIFTMTETSAFGWSSLVPPFRYRLSAYCGSRHCKILKVEKEGLTRLFGKDAKLGYDVMSKIVSIVGRRFDRMREEIIKKRGQDIINQW